MNLSGICMIRQRIKYFRKSEITTRAIDGYLSYPAPKTVLTFVENYSED
jgi:hypothetical protein